jgi:flagellar hook-associated protein 1
MSLGLFQVLNMSARALQTQQAGVEVTGQNLSNVNNANYSRQILDTATSLSIPTDVGMEGTGVEATGIEQVRSQVVDTQIQSENSVSSYWQTQQQALEFAQANLGQQVSSASDGSTTSGQGLASSLSDFFNELQNLSTDPTSLAERQVVVMKAGSLADEFNQVSSQLDSLSSQLNNSIPTDVSNANQLLSDIATLNNQIVTSQINTNSPANDLIDLRQSKIEALSNLVNTNVTHQSDGSVSISIGGVQMVNENSVTDTMETYDAGGGNLKVKATTAGTDLTLTGGSIAGEIDARDGPLATLSNNIDALATQLISAVNTIHASGYNLAGTNGQQFFTGSDAHDIAVNTALVNDPSLVQASGTSGPGGDNSVALALAQLANQSNSALGNQTFNQSYDETVASLGQSLSSANNEVDDQQTVQQMLQQQRTSISGVSLVEEMSNLNIYQSAYEASSHLMSVVDQMLQTLVNLPSSN